MISPPIRWNRLAIRSSNPPRNVVLFKNFQGVAITRQCSPGARYYCHYAIEASFVDLFMDDCDTFRIRKENTDEGYVAFDVGAEIPEGVGMATLDDGISLRRERTHSGVPSERERMRQVPANGTRSQSGRWASSYSIS
jgi:hypothetical protein